MNKKATPRPARKGIKRTLRSEAAAPIRLTGQHISVSRARKLSLSSLPLEDKLLKQFETIAGKLTTVSRLTFLIFIVSLLASLQIPSVTQLTSIHRPLYISEFFLILALLFWTPSAYLKLICWGTNFLGKKIQGKHWDGFRLRTPWIWGNLCILIPLSIFGYLYLIYSPENNLFGSLNPDGVILLVFGTYWFVVNELSRVQQWLYSVLAATNRLVFYIYLVMLPFNLQMNLSFLGGTTQLSRIFLLVTLVLWLLNKLIEPRFKWLWGWWYTIVLLALLLFLYVPRSLDGTLPIIALYLFIINEVPERIYSEVGLVFAISVFIQVIIALWALPGVVLVTSTNAAQFVIVEAFVPLGLVLASRQRWVGQSTGLLVAALVLAVSIIAFFFPAVWMITVVLLMLILWMGIRRRMFYQLILLLVTFLASIFIVVNTIILQPQLFSRVVNISSGWLPFNRISGEWVLLLAMPPLAALVQEYFKVKGASFYVGIFIALFTTFLTVLSISYGKILNSPVTWILWLGLISGTTVVFTIFTILAGSIIGMSDDDWKKVFGWLKLGVALLLLGLILLIASPLLLLKKLLGLQLSDSLGLLETFYFYGILIGLVILGIAKPVVILTFVVGITIIAVGCIVGLAVTLLLGINLNIGCGGVILMVTVIVIALATVGQSLQIMRELWPLVLGVMIGITAWRNQRMWTVTLSASLTGACLFALTSPNIWLSTPYVILLIILIGLWGDKSNIPMGIRVYSKFGN